jgi:hypothetical protein
VEAGHRPAVALLTAVVMLGLIVPAASPARAASAVPPRDALLAVTASAGAYPELHIALDLADGGDAPAQVTLYVPRGFPIYPDRPPDSAVGTVQLTAFDDSYGSFTNSTLTGDIVAQPVPATAASCAPGPYIGVWQLELSLLGQPFDVPVFLEKTTSGDPPGAATKLVVCAPTLPATDPSTARAFPISSLDLFLDDVTAPTAHGSYVWRALITPLAADRKTPRPAHTYELRAATPVPNRLTLGGTRRRAAHTAVLFGRFTGNGSPRRHAAISIVALVRRVTPTGITFDDHVVAHATTTQSGSYRVRVPLKRATTFTAVAEQTVSRCSGAAFAPAGCISLTMPPADSESLVLRP